ncbi:DUF4219 domain-containing protein [Tanacetum coccineum]
MVEDSETKLIKETPYEILEDDQKKKLNKNNEAKMTLYNTLPCKEYERNCKINLLTQEYEKFSISNEETIDSGFTRFNAFVTSIKSFNPDYSSKNHVRKFLHAPPLKWRAKVTTIKEAKDLATLPLDEQFRNLKVYEMILENDGVVSKTTTKEKVKSLSLKAKVTWEQTSDDSDSQDGSDEDVDEDEEAETFNLLARNFRKDNREAGQITIENVQRRASGNKGKHTDTGSQGKVVTCYNCRGQGHVARECKEKKRAKDS